MISLEKLKILTPLQKLPKNVGDLGKLIVAKVAQSAKNHHIWSHCQYNDRQIVKNDEFHLFLQSLNLDNLIVAYGAQSSMYEDTFEHVKRHLAGRMRSIKV